MIRLHLTADDLARIRFAPRPAPLLELNLAGAMLAGAAGDVLVQRWRRRLGRTMPAAATPLRDLVPGLRAPDILDVFTDDLEESLDLVRASAPARVRSELERVYAGHPTPPPPWIRDLHGGGAGGVRAWQLLRRAQLAAYEALVRPVWPLIQDLHQAEFADHALAVAEHGVGTALAELVPASRLREGVWALDAPVDREVEVAGRGVVVRPSFHWTGHPLVCDLPDEPVGVTYAAGPGVPLPLASVGGGSDDALVAVLGRTRAEALHLLAEEHTTSDLARALGVGNATASAHASALRDAGLITTVRAGRAVLHQRTALGTLLVRRRRTPRTAGQRAG